MTKRCYKRIQFRNSGNVKDDTILAVFRIVHQEFARSFIPRLPKKH